METLQKYMKEYRKQLEKGTIQKAYQGMMQYIMALRTHFMKTYPDHFVSGSIYHGYMDMTYFSFIPESLKRRKLKPAILFNHEKFRFEIWLAANNKQIQLEYWKMIKESGWNKYPIVNTTQGADSIIGHILVENPDFDDLDALTEQIESGTLKFIEDVENFLSENEK
jgi:Family of unknown function (DUF7000)